MSVRSQTRRANSDHIVPGGGECRLYRSGRVSVRARSTRFRLGYGEVHSNIRRFRRSNYRYRNQLSLAGLNPIWTLFILSGTMANIFPALATPSLASPLRRRSYVVSADNIPRSSWQWERWLASSERLQSVQVRLLGAVRYLTY